VIHRDIKPSNVMIASHGTGEAAGFRIGDVIGPEGAPEDGALTQPGTLLGSPYYISPEQARGERADARSDVYSTGAMLYEMVAGRPPFDAAARAALTPSSRRICIKRHGRRLSESAGAPELARIILKALAKSPPNGFKPQEFLAALKSIRLDAVRFE
jgi:serine/threonine protein kinase